MSTPLHDNMGVSFLTPVLDRRIIPVPECGCWIWLGTICDGYGKTPIQGRKAQVRLHRFAWQKYHGQIPPGMQVLHRCDVRCCVNPDHLFLGTNQDNVDDKIRKGRHPRGEQCVNAKLSEAQALEIIASSSSAAAAAATFGVNQATILKIRRGIDWPHLQNPAAHP